MRPRCLCKETQSKKKTQNKKNGPTNTFSSSESSRGGGTTWDISSVMERALAHTVGNATEEAYARSDLFELRRGLMEKWGNFLEGDTGR